MGPMGQNSEAAMRAPGLHHAAGTAPPPGVREVKAELRFTPEKRDVMFLFPI